MDPLPVAGQLVTELFFGGDPQGLVREQVHPRRGIGGCRRGILRTSRVCRLRPDTPRNTGSSFCGGAPVSADRSLLVRPPPEAAI